MKKVLILTVTAGNGHNSAANAMKNKLEENGYEVKVVDIIKEYTCKLNSWVVDKGYNIAVGHLRPIYDMFYDAFLKYDVRKAPTCPAQASVKELSGKLLQLIYDFEPDVIYGTSYYCGMALSNLKRVYKIPAKTIVCMLDYVVSPFWEASIEGVDYLTLSNEYFRQELLDKGFDNSQLECTGIPVGEKFGNFVDKCEARKKFGLKEDLFTVFIFYGGGHWHGGYSVLKTLVKHFKEPLQIVIVNGHDEKTKLKIDKELKHYPSNLHIKNIGFSKEVDIIMSASDVMIGKGGGLSTTESINKMLPLVATTKLPGQEYYNVKFLEQQGVGFTFKNKKALLTAIKNLYKNPEKLKDMSANLSKFRTNGLQKIFELIVRQPNANYTQIDKNVNYSKVNKMVNRARKNKSKENMKKSKV
ncbi:MAG: glycosyltransferase [Candidatus Caccovivens sp.]